MTKQNDSSEQQAAEAMIRRRVAEFLGTTLEPKRLTLGAGAGIQVDGVAPDNLAFVEIRARQGALKGGQKHKVANDALKLITLRRDYPDARLAIVFADELAADYATKGTWMAEALAAWNVEVIVVEIDEEVRAGVRAAQVRQEMVSPEASPPADAELD